VVSLPEQVLPLTASVGHLVRGVVGSDVHARLKRECEVKFLPVQGASHSGSHRRIPRDPTLMSAIAILLKRPIEPYDHFEGMFQRMVEP